MPTTNRKMTRFVELLPYSSCYWLVSLIQLCLRGHLALFAHGGGTFCSTGGTTLGCGADGTLASGVGGAGPGYPGAPGCRSSYLNWATLSALACNRMSPMPIQRFSANARRAKSTMWHARSIAQAEFTYGQLKRTIYRKFLSSECIASGYLGLW